MRNLLLTASVLSLLSVPALADDMSWNENETATQTQIMAVPAADPATGPVIAVQQAPVPANPIMRSNPTGGNQAYNPTADESEFGGDVALTAIGEPAKTQTTVETSTSRRVLPLSKVRTSTTAAPANVR